MQEAFKIVIEALVFFDRHLDLVQVLRRISTKLKIEVQLRLGALAVLQLFLIFLALV